MKKYFEVSEVFNCLQEIYDEYLVGNDVDANVIFQIVLDRLTGLPMTEEKKRQSYSGSDNNVGSKRDETYSEHSYHSGQWKSVGDVIHLVRKDTVEKFVRILNNKMGINCNLVDVYDYIDETAEEILHNV